MSVYKAFNAVQKAMAAHGIAKGQKNQQQNYKYRGIDDVYNVLGPLLAEHGLMIVPRVMDAQHTVGSTKSGGASYHHHVVVEYNIYGPDGDRMEPPPLSRGECIDTSDKGLNKALSAAYKYWVLSAFCVPLEGQEEADATTPEAVAPALLTNEQREEILGLCMQTNTNVDQFVAWLGFGTMIEVESSHYRRAINALRAKKEKLVREYAEEQALTAQSIEGEAS